MNKTMMREVLEEALESLDKDIMPGDKILALIIQYRPADNKFATDWHIVR